MSLPPEPSKSLPILVLLIHIPIVQCYCMSKSCGLGCPKRGCWDAVLRTLNRRRDFTPQHVTFHGLTLAKARPHHDLHHLGVWFALLYCIWWSSNIQNKQQEMAPFLSSVTADCCGPLVSSSSHTSTRRFPPLSVVHTPIPRYHLYMSQVFYHSQAVSPSHSVSSLLSHPQPSRSRARFS